MVLSQGIQLCACAAFLRCSLCAGGLPKNNNNNNNNIHKKIKFALHFPYKYKIK